MDYRSFKKSEGVSWKPWADRVKEHLDNEGLEMPTREELGEYYHDDLSYQEVVWKQQFQTRSNQYMTLHVRHANGVTDIDLPHSQSAKDFFSKFKEIRDDF